jgi:hypothetical protein
VVRRYWGRPRADACQAAALCSRYLTRATRADEHWGDAEKNQAIARAADAERNGRQTVLTRRDRGGLTAHGNT